jgi:hypothetical protein
MLVDALDVEASEIVRRVDARMRSHRSSKRPLT